MTVVRLGAIRRYSALSTDPKPVTGVPDGATIYETDTHRNYTFAEGTWSRDVEPLSTDALESLMSEQNVLLRGVRFGLSHLTGVDLSEIP